MGFKCRDLVPSPLPEGPKCPQAMGDPWARQLLQGGYRQKNKLHLLLQSAVGCRWARRSKTRVDKGNLSCSLGSPALECGPQVARRASCWSPILLLTPFLRGTKLRLFARDAPKFIAEESKKFHAIRPRGFWSPEAGTKQFPLPGLFLKKKVALYFFFLLKHRVLLPHHHRPHSSARRWESHAAQLCM